MKNGVIGYHPEASALPEVPAVVNGVFDPEAAARQQAAQPEQKPPTTHVMPPGGVIQ
jgi:hypothetical protein